MPPFLIALIPITLIGLWLALAVLADKELRSSRQWKQTLRRTPHTATWAVLVFALVCGGLALWLGWLGFSEQTKEELYVNLATSLGSIAITVLVIDQLNRWRMAAERKREIIEQMGSPVHDAALEAVRLARKNGWLEDGSLEGAILVGANLEGAGLYDTDLQGAKLEGANLQGARLDGANLESTKLWFANLQGAELRRTKLKDAKLFRANLQGADLGGANLEGAGLYDADLQGAKLEEANLQGADLGRAKLEGAKLEGANLQGSDLGEANLDGANLRWANLQGADLGGAKFQITIYNAATKWPAGFDYVAAGAVSESV